MFSVFILLVVLRNTILALRCIKFFFQPTFRLNTTVNIIILALQFSMYLGPSPSPVVQKYSYLTACRVFRIFFLNVLYASPLGRPRRRWEDKIKIDIREVGWGWGAWTRSIWLRTGTDGWLLWMRQWTFGLHKMRVIAWVAEVLLASQEGLCSMELYAVDT